MKRAIGIVLMLLGIGILVATGYLFPNNVHHLFIDASPFPQPADQFNWVPYASGIIVLVGMIVLLLSKAEVEHHS